MTSRLDEEWARLGEVWRTDEHAVPIGAALEQRVRRHSRRLRVVLVLEVGLTLVALAIVWLTLAAVPARTAWALAAGLHSAIVWAFVLWNRRGIWRPNAETTRAYLSLERERVERQVHAAKFVIGLVTVEALIFVIVALRTVAWRASAASWITAVAVFGGFAVWGAWWLVRARLARRELAVMAERLLGEDREPAS